MKRKRVPIIYRCAVCGEIAHFGYGVFLRDGKEGTWYCFEHKPDKEHL